MKLTILSFGIAKEILRAESITVNTENNITVAALKSLLEKDYTGLKQLSFFMIAVNDEYASSQQVLHEKDEIAIIPPVSGG